ncbi:MAG: 4-hydroxy-tetrahydrodipicolinate synthase [Pseudomonadota bacterium]
MFQGSIPALVTPFRGDVIDESAFEALVERQISAGAGALVPVGTTGETSTLSHAEHKRVVELCVQIARGRVPVIAGAGSNATSEATELAAHAKAIGADAALVVCPYYNKPNQDGLFAHFKSINDSVALPIFVYNVPSRTVIDLAAETLAALSGLPNIIGVKDATGDMDRMRQHRELISEDRFIYLSGDDPTACDFAALGGVGCISVTANVAPKHTVEVQRALIDGNYSAAREADYELAGLHEAMFVSPSPGPAKYALAKMGYCAPDLRLPLTPPDDAARRVIDDALAAARIED